MEKSSGTNTVLLVILLLIIVGALVWFFTSRNTRMQNTQPTGANLQINIPTGNGSGSPSGNSPTAY